MSNTKRLAVVLLVLIAAILACTPTTPTPEGPCFIIAANTVTAYMRPSTSAVVFGTAGGTLGRGKARTADGWIGFDPGVAQAGNVGVFRHRWVEETDDISFDGACDGLPVVWGPPVGICFTMFIIGPTDVHADPDSASAVLETLGPEDHAEILGETADGNWYQIDMNSGNIGINQEGWVESSVISPKGPCDPIPVVTP